MYRLTPICRSFILITLVLIGVNVSAQKSNRSRTDPTPLWIRAMSDSAANYYAAQQDYKAFWKGKEKPEEEESLMSSGTENAKEHIKKLSKKEKKEALQMDYYRYQCKRFEHWLLVNKAYVQKDGRILTADERLKLWQSNQKSKQ